MNHTAFPEPHATATIERTRARWEATKKARPMRVGDTRTEHDCAAYKLPCGTVRAVYDPYRPTYPDGATAGLADLTLVKRFYPNETEGYEITAHNFRALA